MKKETKKWIVFYSPGTLFTEETIQYVDEFPDPYNVEFPEYAFAFQFCKRDFIIDDGGNRYKGEIIYLPPVYMHPDTKKVYLNEEGNISPSLRRSAESMGKGYVLETRFGSYILFEEEFIIMKKQS